ncbi:protein kinase family protein [Nocardioides sp.]|uniref:protein kinase family protein n=1 Tax=Nocardioides sp. TaxID=35761 RepID=UPI002BC1AD5A|nr:protein kinase family protein [Nocardioides sp.]HSX66266.1 protein kinase family protein [Nocardioides sp.]
MRPGDVLASRYRLTVLLHDRNGGRFWRAHDLVLARDVALHLIPQDDPRGPLLEEAARRSATVQDPRLLRVLDSNSIDGLHYVVNEWGEGVSLNNLVADEPLSPVRAAWLVAEVAAMVAAGHDAGIAHGRLVPENVLLDTTGAVKVIGFAVDAALHGLPPGRTTADLTDLGGLLYAALTGRWAGVSESAVPAAPLEHGRPLRPRQVRAGVPRLLDGMCESLLGGGTRFTSATEIAEALTDYVGDPTIVAEAEAHRLRTGAVPAHRPGSGDTDATGALAAVPAVPSAADPASAEPEETMLVDVLLEDEPADDVERTQVAAFDDVDDAVVADPDWHTPSDVAPAPPPPFEEPPERPLFAPDPPEGRLRRLPPPTADDRGYWPFGSTGELPAVAIAEPAEHGDETPGRNWMRVGLVLLALLVLLPVAYVVAGLLQNDGDTSTGSASDGPSAGAVVTGVTATAFDPPPGDGEEHDSEAKLAVDGDPATAWTTSGYDQNFGPGGLKPGVGLVLDLGSSRSVTSVEVTVAGGPTTVQLLAAGETLPQTADGLEKAATGDGSGTITLTPESAVDSRYVVLWLTAVPQVDGEFRGSIAAVEVRA